MNHQEIFTKVATHLLKQNEKSMRLDETRCAYRGHAGRTCAVGFLIPDYLYHPDMEGGGVYDALVYSALVNFNLVDPDTSYVSGSRAALLSDLQGIHDRVSPSGWKHELERMADKYKLVMP